MIREHGDAVEASLAFLGIDLLELFRPGSTMTVRRAWLLIRSLPPESLLMRILREELIEEQKQAEHAAGVKRYRDAEARYSTTT